MASPELSLFSYEILGLVGREGAGAARPAAAGQARPDARVGRREPVLHRAQATRQARLPVGPQGTRQDPRAHRLHAHRQGPGGAARIRANPGYLHAAQERSAAAPAHLRPRRRGRHAREHGDAPRRHRRHPGPARGRRAHGRRSCPTASKYLLLDDRLPPPLPRAAPRAGRPGRAGAAGTTQSQHHPSQPLVWSRPVWGPRALSRIEGEGGCFRGTGLAPARE